MIPPATDYSRWRLRVKEGRQLWEYLSEEEAERDPQRPCDQYHLGTYTSAPELPAPRSPLDSARNGFEFFRRTQTDDGHWAGEYGGPMFIIPGFAIAMYITKTPFAPGQREEMVRYIKNRAHKEDGGWGIHIEGISTVFGTALNYVALRLMGVGPDDPVCAKARKCLHGLGGAIAAPAWGKFWLSVLNVYSWEGMNPVPPELWILPYAIPLHSGRYWCHTRMVYLAMGWFYANRCAILRAALTPGLLQELYVEPYDKINWSKAPNCVSEADLYTPHSKLMDMANVVLHQYEKVAGPKSWLRSRAIAEVVRQIRFEDENTKYLDIAPVSKAMNMLLVWIIDGPKSETWAKHLERVPDVMWLGREGMMCSGTNGSQLWDTAFVVQALVESGLAEEEAFRPHVLKAFEFIDDCQIKENPKHHLEAYRYMTKGAWPFSTRDQGWTVSDCTAEGLKTVLLLQNKLSYTEKRVSDERMFDAVNVLLNMQNADGGFATYEPRKGPFWLEWFNPAEVFGNIMVDYSYVECTTAVLLGLTSFRKYFPNHRKSEIRACLDRCVKFIKGTQRQDGSWYGSWAVCFTYATWFGVEALASIGEDYHNSDNVRRACEFLISKQEADGGWGEAYKACEIHEWVSHEKSQVVMTSWAVMALMAAKYPDETPIRRGIQLIMDRQLPTGEWLQEGIEGVFNHNCMISYPNYKFAFTIWALGRYAALCRGSSVSLPSSTPSKL
ncbi:terpenoid cyclases/protein prenyltransferase alpha-alpha toroid [Hyaloraphidium curvatum]|nr:terpenoid cyclases/protein prenyltransferase alpha-alpha toroid [Hyaloraphidium curvatum]